MSSKGLDCYFFSSDSKFKVLWEARGNGDVVCSIPNVMQGWKHLEIDSSDLGYFEHSGCFRMKAWLDNRLILEKYAEIAPTTGNLCATDLGDMLNTPPFISKDMTVCYGFSDTGMGRSDQAYMYVTENYSHWMGDLMAANPDIKKQSFQVFVLPGSHDSGMFTGINNDSEAKLLIANLIKEYSTLENLGKALLGALAGYTGASIISPLLPSVAVAFAGVLSTLALTTSTVRRAIINLAYTQKDDIKTQLALGARFFDFRPGYNVSSSKTDEKLRHQHLFIPGYEFDKFLFDVVSFLKSNLQEIVVVNINYNGFMKPEMIPLDTVVEAAIAAALNKSDINLGNVTDLTQTIDTLLTLNKRLIIMYGNGKTFEDSYNDVDYGTDQPASVIKAIDSTLNTVKPVIGKILQLQATYLLKLMQNKTDLAGFLITFSDATSPLLFTKSRFDNATYTWVEKNCNGNVGNSGLVVLLNDFVDNALTYHAISATTKRGSTKHFNNLYIRAVDYTHSSGNITSGDYGEGVIYNCGDGTNMTEYSISATPGTYSVWILFTAEQSRPVKVEFNETLIKQDAISEITGSWMADRQTLSSVGPVDVKAGDNILRLSSMKNRCFPHIQTIILMPCFDN